MNSGALGLAIVGGALLVGSTAQAHIALTNPMNRYGDLTYENAYQKSSPCGNADNVAGMFEPVVYEAGSTITITVDEYVQHTGFIRVAISDSDQDFIAPTTVDDIGDDPSTVYLMPDLQAGGDHLISVTLPDTPCNPCVLQVIQTMTTSGGAFNSNYFQCADIILEPAAATGNDSAGSSSTGDDSAGTTGTDDTATSAPGSTTDETSGGGSDSGTGSTSTTASTTGGPSGATATEGTGDTDLTLTGESNDGDNGCGCQQTNGTAPGWAAVVLLGLLGLRRRRG